MSLARTHALRAARALVATLLLALVPTTALATSAVGVAAAGSALRAQGTTAPYEAWIESWNVYYNGNADWSSNRVLDPMATYRIQARDTRGGDAYTWRNATKTIAFTPAPDKDAVYRTGHTGPFNVMVSQGAVTVGGESYEGGTTLDGLFYKEDDLELPLPAGRYTITFTADDGTTFTTNGEYNEYTTDPYPFLYIVNQGDSIIASSFYEASAQGALTRGALSVRAAGTEDELAGLIDLDSPIDLRLSVRTAGTLTAAPKLGTSGKGIPDLTLYRAVDADGNQLSLTQLEQLYQQGDLGAWPARGWWASTAAARPQTLVWQRSTATVGSNGTTWSFTPDVGAKTGTFAISGLTLGTKVGTAPTLEPGVYFPVLNVQIDGELYRYAYNPIEVGHVLSERQDPTIVTETLPSAMRGTVYATTLAAHTGVEAGAQDAGTMSWAVTAGSLPEGLALDAATGTISGTPTAAAATQTFTLTLTETAGGVSRTASREYAIVVRDAVTLGDISYSKETIYIEDQDGAKLHLSVPVSADLSDKDLNLTQSDVVYRVYQTSRYGGSSLPEGSTAPVTSLLSTDGKTLEIDAPISYTTATIDAIEVLVRLCDNVGNKVQMPKEGDATGEGEWAIVAARVDEPGILMGSYVRFPSISFGDDADAGNLPTKGRVRLWPYVPGDTTVPPTAIEKGIARVTSVWMSGSALYKLEPGTYAFTIEGEVATYREDGTATGATRWVNIAGSVVGAEPIANTSPQQWRMTIGGNVGTEVSPLQVDVAYTTTNIDLRTTYMSDALFETERSGVYESQSVSYAVRWYRRTGADEASDVLVATGGSVELGPSKYPLYVEVVPTGRDTAFWRASERVIVTNDDDAQRVAAEVRVPRKQLFSVTLTLKCASGKEPAVGETWGVIEVQTPLATGDTSSYNLWPTREANIDTVTIPNITSGSVITWTPRIELEAGQESYTVPADKAADYSATITAPRPSGLVSLEGLSFTDVDGRQTALDLTDGLTGVTVHRLGKYQDENAFYDVDAVPYYVADATRIVLQPEQGWTHNYFEDYATPTRYALTVTRRDGTAPERMGTTHPDVACSQTYTVELSRMQTQATVKATGPLGPLGYVVVPFDNPDGLLCTLLLFDGSGALVESGPAGSSASLRTPYLAAGDYTLYAVDANYLPQSADDYKTEARLRDRLSAHAGRMSAASLTVREGRATTAATLAFPRRDTSALVNQAASSVSLAPAYTDKLALTMHVELAGGATVGAGARLEIHTNQRATDVGGAYAMTPRSLTVNGRPVNLGQWSETPGPVLGSTSGMADGSLTIDLDALKKEIGAANVGFPMDVTLVIPQTVLGYTEASAWLVTGSGATRSLVGSHYGDANDVTLTVPKVAAWKTFGVYGDAGPGALVTVYVDGMRAATTKADSYGYYEAQVTLPDEADDFDTYTIMASAQWTRGGAAYAAVSEVATTIYSTTYPAVERVTLCYQPKADEPFEAVRLWYRGAELNKYLTIQRNGHTEDNQRDERDSQFFYLVEYANGDGIESVRVSIPTAEAALTPQVTDKLATAEEWVPEVRDATAETDELYRIYARYGWSISSAGSLVKGALERSGGGAGEPRAFVSKPVSFSSYSDDMELSFELAEREETVGVLPASDLGAYAGWAGEKVDGKALSADQLATALAGMGSFGEARDRGRLLVLSASDKDQVDAETITDLAELTEGARLGALASSLREAGGTVDEWLLVGGTDAAGDEERALPVHHTITTVSMEAGALKTEVTGIVAGATRVASAYEAWCANGTVSADASVAKYGGQAVVAAGGTAVTGYLGMPYFVETIDAAGNSQAEWMNVYDIEGANGRQVWCQTLLSRDTMRTTWWNEKYGQKVTMTYTLPASALAGDTGTLRYADVLWRWHYLQQAILANVDAGGDALGDTLSTQGTASAGTASAGAASLSSRLLRVQDSAKKTPKQQSKITDLLTNVGEWKLWWDGNDKPNEEVVAALDDARADDPAGAADPNSSWWSGKQGQGGTAGELNNLKKKADAGKALAAEGGKSVAKDMAGHVSPVAGQALNFVEHWDWIKKQAGRITGQEERDYQLWKWYRQKFGDPTSYSIRTYNNYQRLITGYDRATLDQWNYRYQKEMAALRAARTKNPKKKADPSGIVYEAVLSNPVEGATATLYSFNGAAALAGLDPAQFVDSERFGLEKNPQTTDSDGSYQWFVPEGFWQVRVTKDGYEPASTGDSADFGLGATKPTVTGGGTTVTAQTYWMPVTPEQINVNIPLTSHEPPTVESFVPDETGATVTFTRYVHPETVTATLFTLNGAAPSSARALDAEAAGDGSTDEAGESVMLARSFRLTYAGGATVDAGDEVSVDWSEAADVVESYAGVRMVTGADSYTMTAEATVDEGAVQSVTELIAALPAADEATRDDRPAVEAALAAYDALSAAQQGLVARAAEGSNHAKLAAVEAAVAADERLYATEQSQATAVAAQIEALPAASKITLANQAKVAAAQAAFDKLSERARSLVAKAARDRLAEAVARIGTLKADATTPHTIKYTTHVQNVGWQGWVADGRTAGTSGRGLRLEAIRLELASKPYSGGISYRTHIQNVGWQAWKSDGALSGTSGRGLRLEAIQIRLTSAMASHYDVYYRVHAQNVGWMGWARNGAMAGTAGYGWRLEAIQVKLVAKGSAASGTTAAAYRDKSGAISGVPDSESAVLYRTHVQNVGWQGWMRDGELSGTSGRGLRLEGINLKVGGGLPWTGGISYRTHIQNVGWQAWRSDGELSGTSGRSLRLEAIQIKLTGELAKRYDVWYCVHAQNVGWMGWAKNGAQAGTAGYGYRLEAIRVRLVERGGKAPGSTAGAFRSR